ncbi:MAG: folylpolyglutamate synthase/dihydrofolate synthase family protein [Dissulfuribacterales bacterium]
MNYSEAIAYLNTFQFHGFKLGLERTEAILKALGDPHRAYPVIHVAGTNGKGSVCAYLSSILKEAGYKVGRYTSPHLLDLTERFDINGQPISKQELAGFIGRIRGYVERGFELSYFEYTTAIAFKWFEEQSVEIAVVETGLGGRLDATNVVQPICSVITNVDFDHMSYLGDTIGKIAFEKAGIIKPEVPVVTGVQQSEALLVIEERAGSFSSPVFRLGQEFSVRASNDEMEYVGLNCHLKDIKPQLAGRHQYANAALALAACEIMKEKGFKTGEDAMKQGIAAAIWPCRGESIPLADGRKLLIDGAHNPNGIQALCALLSDIKNPPEESALLFAASNEGKDKDFGAMLCSLMPFFERIYVTEPPGPRRPVTIEEWQALGLPQGITYIGDWREILNTCLSTKQNRLICVAGSLYLVGAIRHEVMHG